MTVSTEVDHNDYTGNGVTTSFPYTFRIFQKTDLMVQVVDLSENITVLTLDTDYSVMGAGTYSGGSVVLSSPLANGWQISISRSLPVTQDTDLRNQGKFFAEVHEDAFDKLTMLIQQCFSFLRLALRKPSFIANYYDALNNRIRNLRDPSQAQDAATKSYVDVSIAGSNSHADNLFKRTIRVPEESVNQVPAVEVRKNSLFGWNSLGDPIPIFDMTETADLAIKLASTSPGLGDNLVGHESGEFQGTLNEYLDEAIKYVSPGMGFSSLKDCCEYASENGIELVKVPEGVFNVTESISVSGTFRISGAGIGKTIIKQLSSAADGIFNHALNSANDAIAYEGFTIQTQKPYSPSNYGIRIDMRAQLSGTEIANRTRYRGYIRDVEISGSYTRSDGIGFGACIDLISTGWVDLERIRLSGCATPGTQFDMKGVGILQRGDGKPVETRIQGLRAYNFEYAYLCPEYTEGIYFTESLAVNCKWGAVVSPVSEWIIGTLGQTGCYQFNVDQFHANVSMGAVFLSGTKYASVTNLMLILDDHSQTSSIVGVHLRNGYGNTTSNIQAAFYNIDGTTGITRQAVIANGITDSFFEKINARTESATYENISQVIRLVNSSLRNRFHNVNGINADIGFSVATGCGNNSASGYRFQNVTTPVDDQAGDFNRGNSDARYATFTPTAGSASYTLAVTPREYFTRRPNGVSASITSPTTLSFPVDIFYDYANSTATVVILIIKPTSSGNTLPAVQFGVAINMKD